MVMWRSCDQVLQYKKKCGELEYTLKLKDDELKRSVSTLWIWSCLASVMGLIHQLNACLLIIHQLYACLLTAAYRTVIRPISPPGLRLSCPVAKRDDRYSSMPTRDNGSQAARRRARSFHGPWHCHDQAGGSQSSLRLSHWSISRIKIRWQSCSFCFRNDRGQPLWHMSTACCESNWIRLRQPTRTWQLTSIDSPMTGREPERNSRLRKANGERR